MSSKPGQAHITVYEPSPVSADFQWSLESGGDSRAFAWDVAADFEGNVLVTGSFSSVIDFGGVTLTNSGSLDNYWGDLFVGKYSASGQLLWINQAGGEDNDSAWGIAVDRLGNCYVTGHFQGAARFGAVTITNVAASGPQFFLAKYDKDGHLAWVRQNGGQAQSFGNAVAVDQEGNCYLTGSFYGNSDWDGTLLPNRSAGPFGDIFIAKYDSEGLLNWVQQAGGEGDDAAIGLSAVGSNGGVAIVGSFEAEAAFGSTVLTNQSSTPKSFGGRSGFVARYSSDGKVLWASRFAYGDDVFPAGIVSDLTGSLFIAGSFSGKATLGDIALTNLSSRVGIGHDAFVAKLDNTGNVLWAKQFGGLNSQNFAYDVALTPSNGCIVAGSFSKVSQGAGVVSASAGQDDLFALELTAQGETSKFTRAGGKASDAGLGVAVSATGEVYTVGAFGSDGGGLGHLLIGRLGVPGATTAPKFFRQPQDQAVGVGQQVTFGVTASGGAPLAYQWLKDGIPLPGEIFPTLYIYVESSGSGGIYRVQATNTSGMILSGEAVLTVLDDADGDEISDTWEREHGMNPFDPSDASLDPDLDGMSNLEEFLAGTGPQDRESYLKIESVSVTGDERMLHFLALTNKSYSIEWKETLDSPFWKKLADSAPVFSNHLTGIVDPLPSGASRLYRLVTPKLPDAPDMGPIILTAPKSVIAPLGSDAAFSVLATGTGPLLYQWLFNEQEIPLGTNATLIVKQITIADGGRYVVEARDATGSTLSRPALLQPLVLPTIILQPQDQTILAGENALFSVQAVSELPIGYQWFHNRAVLSGETNRTLSLPDVQNGAEGLYSVFVRALGPTGRGLMSSNAVLGIHP